MKRADGQNDALVEARECTIAHSVKSLAPYPEMTSTHKLNADARKRLSLLLVDERPGKLITPWTSADLSIETSPCG
jgi:hypothetical protein